MTKFLFLFIIIILNDKQFIDLFIIFHLKLILLHFNQIKLSI